MDTLSQRPARFPGADRATLGRPKDGARLPLRRVLDGHRSARGLRAGVGRVPGVSVALASGRVTSIHAAPVVCLGFAEWDSEIPTNQHHLMAELSRRTPVLFIESLGLRRPTLSARDVRRMLRRLARSFRPLHRYGNVHVLTPAVVPYHDWAPVRGSTRRSCGDPVKRTMRGTGFSQPILWAYAPRHSPSSTSSTLG